MAKITKHAEFLTSLQKAMSKQAENPTATGVPGKDTHYVSVSEKTEHVDKNSQGKPEKNPQDFHQKPSGDASEPSKAKHGADAAAPAVVDAPAAEVAKEASAGAPAAALPDTGKAPVAKAAESKTEQKVAAAAEEPAAPAAAPATATSTNVKLAELGEQLLKLVEGMSKEAEKPEASGVPGKDTHYVSVSEKTEHVDKNKQGKPEKNPQDFSQKPSGDKSEPAKAKKAADEVIGEEAEKIASYEFGRSFFRELVKNAVAQPAAAAPAPQQVKTAGRRDFEQLIAQAAAELEQQQVEKQAADYAANEAANAEAAGAAAFQQFYKQAQYEQALVVAQQTEAALNQKLAALETEKVAALKRVEEAEKLAATKEAALNEKVAAEKRAEEFRAWSEFTAKSVIDQLKHEILPSQR